MSVYDDNRLTKVYHSRYAAPTISKPEHFRHDINRIVLEDESLNHSFLGTDARFPNVNQTKHCWQNYVDYHKCIIAKGEDFAPCRQVR